MGDIKILRDELQFKIVEALSREFTNVFLINTVTRTSRPIKLESKIAGWLDIENEVPHPYEDSTLRYMDMRVVPEDKDRMLKAVKLDHVMKELEDKAEYSCTYRIGSGDDIHHYQVKYIRMEGTNIIIEGYQNIDDIVRREKEKNEYLESMLDIVNSLAQSYDGVYYVDLTNMTYETVWSNRKEYSDVIPPSGDCGPILKRMCDEAVRAEFVDRVREFVDLTTVNQRLMGKKSISVQFIGRSGKWIEGSFVPSTRGENIEHSHVLWAVKTIQEQKLEEDRQQSILLQALDAAKKANQSKTAFLNSMSHDIRTPLNAIMGYSELALAHPEDPVAVRDYMTKISVSGNHLLNLINDILDMSRIESGRMEITEEEVLIPAVVQELWTIIQANITAKKQKLYIDTEKIHNQTVYTDRLHLNQVLINILGNAIKFTPEEGTIYFSVKETDCTLQDYTNYEFRVKDTGIGMSREFMDHIFEPFAREQTSTVSGIGGTGLGMAITHNIVDAMGGNISVNSEMGVGTEFIVNIPCRTMPRTGRTDETKNMQEHPKKKPNPDDFVGKRILLVEDNELNQEIAQTILRENGFEVETVGDGTYAVERMAKAGDNEFDVILMDIQMPLMDGYEATKRIRSLGSERAQIPIVAMTANAFEEDKRKAFEAGMNGFVTKPIRIPLLMECLAEILA